MNAHAETTDVLDRIELHIAGWVEIKPPNALVEVRADLLTSAYREIADLRFQIKAEQEIFRCEREHHAKAFKRMNIGLWVLFVFTVVFALLSGMPRAAAQDRLPSYTFTMTEEEVGHLSRAIHELPKKIADPLLDKLSRQAAEQMAAARAKAEADKAKAEVPK